MKLYRIRQDGFDIGLAKGKKQAVEWLKNHLQFEGIAKSTWTTFKYNICTVKTMFHVFTIEEAA